jgi:hypothetical protein
VSQALLEVADFLIRLNLVDLCQRTLDVADKCEATALDKAKERAMQTVTPVSLRVRNRRLRAQALLSLGNLDQAAQEVSEGGHERQQGRVGGAQTTGSGAGWRGISTK